MAKKSAQVEQVAVDTRLYLTDLQAFAATEQAIVTFKHQEELYHVEAGQTTLSYMAQDAAMVDPLLAFQEEHGFPFIDIGNLKEMPGGSQTGAKPYFRVERLKNRVGSLALYTWNGMMVECSKVVGRDVETEKLDTSLRGLLKDRGIIAPEFLEVASRSVQEGETFGQALIRLDFAAPRDLLFAAMGGSRLFNPTCRMANAIGQTLVEDKAITKLQLKKALARQIESGKSLAELLHKGGIADGKAISAAAAKLSEWPLFLPSSDKVGEVLIKRGKISRTQLMSALFKLQGTGKTLGTYLVDEEACSGEDLADAESWHDLKLRLRTVGKVRIGEILIGLGYLDKELLKEALLLQVDREEPLCEILISEAICSPEAVIDALLEQDTRLDDLVASKIIGNEKVSISDLPLFDIPEWTLSGGKVKPPEETKKPVAKGGKPGTKGAATSKGKGKGKGKREPEPPKFAWKPIAGVGAAVVAFGFLAFGTIKLVGALSAPKGVTVPVAVVSPSASPVASAAPGLDGKPAETTRTAAAVGTVPAAGESAPPVASEQTQAADAALPATASAVVPQGGIQQQAAAGHEIMGDKTSLSHLSNAELKNIAKKNPLGITAEDVDKKGGRISEVLDKAEKSDPNFAKAVAAARKTSGADILSAEMNNLESDAPGTLKVIDQSGGGGAPTAKAAAGAASAFRSAETAAVGGEGSEAVNRAQADPDGALAGGSPMSAGGAARLAGQPNAGGQAGQAGSNQAQARQSQAQQQQFQAQQQQAQVFDEKELRQKVAANPKDAGARNALGVNLMQQNKPAEAEKVLQEARRVRPNDPVVNHNLATSLIAQKKGAAAVPLLEKSQAGFKAEAAAAEKQATVAQSRLDVARSEAQFEKAIRANGLSANSAAKLGTAFQQQGKKAQAKVKFRQAAETVMANSRLHTKLGQLHALKGNHKRAVRAYKIAAQLDPRSGTPWYFLGKEAQRQRKVLTAKRYFRTALRKEPKGPYAKEIKKLI